MPKTLQEILDHADDMSAAFDDFEPDPSTLRDPAPMLRARTAVQARARAEADVATAVADMRSAGYSWAAVGMVLGTSGEAARQRYGEPPAESAPGPRPPATRAPAAKVAAATRAPAKVASGGRTRVAAAKSPTGGRTRAAAAKSTTDPAGTKSRKASR